MSLKLLTLLSFLIIVASCKNYNPRTAFEPSKTPAAPDYSKSSSWAALPDRVDLADRTPNPTLKDNQTTATVDVFFLYPTTLTESVKNGDHWNGDVADTKLNKKTDESSILFQASAFNGAGKIYAPRYRQAHYYSFVTKDEKSADQALDTAYSDVVAAFKYYLKHYNQGRPFILAGHSQGARHAMRITRDFIEGTPLEKQLVAAYFAGWPVPETWFKSLKPCDAPDDTGCFCTWRTFERKYGLKKATQKEVVCTNPVIWTIAPGMYASKSLQKGAVLRKFEVVYPKICDAEVYNGVLLCTKPKFPGSFLLRTKNYHIGDINLYYMDIRENAVLRASKFSGSK